MTKKRIGITCQIDADGGFGLFSNGIRQTAVFLYRLFKKNGHAAFLVTGPSAVPNLQTCRSFGIEPEDLQPMPEVDVLIVCSRQLWNTEHKFYKEDRKTKIILYKGSQGGINSMEAVCRISGHHRADHYDDADWYDALWLPSHYGHAYRSWCETVYKCPVLVVPPVWEPLFIPLDFGFKIPERGEWRLGVMEPNNTVTRTCHMPLMSIRMALMSTEEIKEVTVLNAAHLVADPHFDLFMRRLLFKHPDPKVHDQMRPQVHLSNRIVGPVFMAQRCDMLVTHDWENSLNYVYFEALYGGYPLIHVSPYLSNSGVGNFGYHYAQWSAGSGGMAIRSALDSHDAEATKSNFCANLLPQLQNYSHHEAFL